VESVRLNPHAHDPLEEVGMPRSHPPEFRRKVLDLIAAGDCTKPGGTQFGRSSGKVFETACTSAR
jgi:hypothetical protein